MHDHGFIKESGSKSEVARAALENCLQGERPMSARKLAGERLDRGEGSGHQ